MNAREFLGGVPFFAEVLDAKQLDALAVGARRVEFDHQSVLMRELDPGGAMFAIVSGTIEVSTGHGGHASHVATLHPRDIVGEMSLLTGARRSAMVTAIGPVVALEIDRATLEPILAASPALHDRFATMIDMRRSELDRIYGHGFWTLYGVTRDQIASAIRSFFAPAKKV